MISKEILLIIIGFGALQSFLISAYFILKRNQIPNKSNLFLGLLFLAIGIRVSKSIYFLFLNGESVQLYNIGFAAHATIGPLLYLYIKRYIDLSINFWLDILHFIPAILLLLATPWLTLGGFWYVGGYSFLLIYSVIYLIPFGYLFLKNYSYFDHVEKRWFMSLFIGIALFLVAYFTNYSMRWNSYELGPMLYGIVIYLISFFVLTNQGFFKKSNEQDSKYKNLNLSEEQSKNYQDKIEAYIETYKPHLNAEFNLKNLSESLQIPAHLLSYIFNEVLRIKFTDYINAKRIAVAKVMLMDKKNAHLKIASIAHEVGFNSLSAFNASFKKFAGNTPSKFRNE